MKKKLISIILITAALFTLVACNDNKENNSVTSENNASESVDETNNEKK